MTFRQSITDFGYHIFPTSGVTSYTSDSDLRVINVPGLNKPKLERSIFVKKKDVLTQIDSQSN